MSPEYHAWTHRPKAKGGTDPIENPIEWMRRINVDGFTVVSGGGLTDVVYEDGGDDDDPSITGSTAWQSYFECATSGITRPKVSGFYVIMGQYVWENQFTEPRAINFFDGYDYETAFSYSGHASFDEPFGQAFTFTHRYPTIAEVHSIVINLQHGNASNQDIIVGYTEFWYLGPYTGSDPVHDATGTIRGVGDWEE